MSEESSLPRGKAIALGALVFFGGFSVMVLEIVGAKFLQTYFGSEFYIWVSQIGVVMLALAMGYAVGGRLADHWKHARYLGALQLPSAVFILLIPSVAPGVLNAIVDRHGTEAKPAEASASSQSGVGPGSFEGVDTTGLDRNQSDLNGSTPLEPGGLNVEDPGLFEGIDTGFLDGNTSDALDPVIPPPPEPEDKDAAMVPEFWRKVDPAIGSAIVFLLRCFVLAMISPYMIRIAAQQVSSQVGTVSGLVYAASTVGSIGGVVVTAYVLIDHFGINTIFYITAGLTLGLAGLCCLIDWLWPENLQEESD